MKQEGSTGTHRPVSRVSGAWVAGEWGALLRVLEAGPPGEWGPWPRVLELLLSRWAQEVDPPGDVL